MWQLDNIQDICQAFQKQKFRCTYVCSHVLHFFNNMGYFGTYTNVWSYQYLSSYTLGFVVGAFLPMPFYLLSRGRYPQLRHVYIPTLLLGGILWAPLNLSWIIPGVYLGYIFQVYIKRHFFNWWSSYNVSPPRNFLLS
jgi:hypothetical protein